MTVLYTSRISVLGNLQISESFVKCSSLSFVSVRDYLTERGLPFSSVVQSCPTLCDPVDCSTPGLPVHHHPGAYSNSCPLSRWCHPTSSPSVVPFSSHLQSFPASGSFPVSQLFASGGQSIGVSASASVLPMNIQNWFPYDGLVGSPCSPQDSQESSSTPQFKSIYFSALSFHYSPTLISIHDHWKNHSFNHTDLCWQNDVSAFCCGV